MSKQLLYKVLMGPHVSEKSTLAADKAKQIVFKVDKAATKTQVKKAVEHIFDVKVKNVSIMNVHGKVKRFGQRLGKRNDWKKAYVSLEDGYDINFANAE